MSRFAEISAALSRELSPRRQRHSLAVARLAGELAALHGEDREEARLCGLVHDCAKEWKPEELMKRVTRRRLAVPNLSFIRETSPGLLHAYVSADVARERGWLSARRR
jgi:putative nucleotidyltransferase with HDIG domain